MMTFLSPFVSSVYISKNINVQTKTPSLIFSLPWGIRRMNEMNDYEGRILSWGLYCQQGGSLSRIFKARRGFTRIPNILFGKILTAAEFRVLAVICYHLPNAFPSIERISLISGITRRHAIRIINSLEKKGLIWKTRQTGKSTTYAVLSKEKFGG